MEHVERTNELNYQDLFIVGICFIGAGSVFTTMGMIPFIGLVGMGLCFIVIGLANRKKWKK